MVAVCAAIKITQNPKGMASWTELGRRDPIRLVGLAWASIVFQQSRWIEGL